MLLIIPRKYEFETTLTPKRVARKLDGELTEFRPSLNIMSTGKFMKTHKFIQSTGRIRQAFRV